MNIKKFYCETYKTDDYGTELDESATFDGLLDRVSDGRDIYDYIGVGDSVIRERLFEKLADKLDVPYNYIYDVWLNS
mgnify:CR=1 FL=1